VIPTVQQEPEQMIPQASMISQPLAVSLLGAYRLDRERGSSRGGGG